MRRKAQTLSAVLSGWVWSGLTVVLCARAGVGAYKNLVATDCDRRAAQKPADRSQRLVK